MENKYSQKEILKIIEENQLLKIENEQMKQKIKSIEVASTDNSSQFDHQDSVLNNLFMNAPAGICILEGSQHVYTFANPIYNQLTGNRDLLNKPIREAVPEIQGQGFFELLDDVYNTGKPFIGKEMPGQLANNPDGTLIHMYFNFVFQPMFDSDHKVTGISMFAFDVTDLVLSRKKTEKLNEELESFNYIASHDLQSPLRTIASYSNIIQKRYKDHIDHEADELLDLIVLASNTMKNLIDDLLKFSRLGKQEIKNNKTDLNVIIKDIIDINSILIKENNVVINYPELPTVNTESSHMLQLFQNLISNSIKYKSKTVDPIIDISVKKENNRWLFTITDNGIGIKNKYFKQIFEPFRRLHSNSEYPGTGIGLSTVKKIVELYNGEILIQSELGKGTTFSFTLP